MYFYVCFEIENSNLKILVVSSDFIFMVLLYFTSIILKKIYMLSYPGVSMMCILVHFAKFLVLDEFRFCCFKQH